MLVRVELDVGSNHSGPNAGNDAAEAVALQPDGRIVVAGRSRSMFASGDAARRVALTRNTPDGQIDRTSGTDGKVQTALPGPPGSAYAVPVQPDGKTVIAGGGSHIARKSGFVVARYNRDRSPDS